MILFKYCIKNHVNFLIRANLKRNVCLSSEFDEQIKECHTKKEKEALFYSLESLIKKLNFKKHHENKYQWFEIAWFKICIPASDYSGKQEQNKEEKDNKKQDIVITVNLIAVNITKKTIEGIEEDLSNNKKKREKH